MKIWEKEIRAGTPGIWEAVPRSSNARLAFDHQQEKDETPSTWLARLRQNFQLFSSVDAENPEGQAKVEGVICTESVE